MNIKPNLIDLLDEFHQITLTFIDGLTETQRSAASTPEQWTAKDNVAHMTVWIERFCNNLDTARRGEPVSEDEPLEKANQEIYEQHKQWEWEAIIEKVNRVHAAIRAQVEAMSEEDLQATQFFGWQNRRPMWQVVAGSYCIHPIMHMAPFLIQHGNPTQASHLMESVVQKLLGLDNSIPWQGVTIYNLACHYAQAGELDKAVTRLGEALRIYPEIIEWSKQDTDLDPLRDKPAFQELMHSLENV